MDCTDAKKQIKENGSLGRLSIRKNRPYGFRFLLSPLKLRSNTARRKVNKTAAFSFWENAVNKCLGL